MSHNLDYMQGQPFPNTDHVQANIDHKRLQSHKWRVLIGSFLVILICSCSFIWMRPAVYQSQASLHFSYVQTNDQTFSELARHQIAFHTQRLLNNAVLDEISNQLNNEFGVTLGVRTDIESLRDMLSVESSVTGRLITLKATGDSPNILKPIIDAWIRVYLHVLAQEKQVSSFDDKNATQNQLALLQDEIQSQKQKLAIFAQTNNITSVERDENRVLNRVKNLSNSLDSSSVALTEKVALLKTLTNAVKSKEIIIRPSDQSEINITQSKLNELSATLKALSEKFTQAYLDRDPDIVASQNELTRLESLLAEQRVASQQAYINDTQREVDAERGKLQDLRAQLDTQNKLAQVFSQNLEEYKTLDSGLKALQNQAQEIRSRQIEKDVVAPFEAKIDILEHPFTPDFPIGPNNSRDTLIALVSSVITSIVALMLYSFITRQKFPQGVSSNIIVVPNSGTTNSTLSHHLGNSANAPQNLSHQMVSEASLLGMRKALRLLNQQECIDLYNNIDDKGKVVVSLVLSGVSPNELLDIKIQDFGSDFSYLTVNNAESRKIQLPEYLAEPLRKLAEILMERDGAENIWFPLDAERDLEPLIVNAAYDARLSMPENIDLESLRHTYISFLVEQGVKLNQVPDFAGAIAPNELARYRDLAQRVVSSEHQEIHTFYPLV